MCQLDWTAVAAWIGALSTTGLLIAAYYGFHVWKSQFLKQRDHDLALIVLRKMDDSTRELDALRSPVGILTDGDVPIEKSNYDDEQQDWDYRKMSARYQARHRHSFVVANERIDAVHEALLIWDDCANELKELADQLSEKERQVFEEAYKFVESLHPNAERGVQINRDILYAQMDRDVENPFADDPFASEYVDIVVQIRTLLQSKLRLE